RHFQSALGHTHHLEHVAVGLVVDLPDEFLDEVFHGDDALAASVLVDDDGEMVTTETHPPQRVERADRFGQYQGGTGQPSHRPRLAPDQVTNMDDPHHLIQLLTGSNGGT